MNIVEYAESSLDTFEDRPFCEVDSLVLSQFVYINLPKALLVNEGTLRVKDLFRSELFADMFDTRVAKENRQLLTAMASGPRFRDLKLSDFVEILSPEEEEQFAAITIEIKDGLHYIACRGTDSTFIGWKEDFNMAYREEIPSQRHALQYLEHVSKHQTGELLLGGHSKGGNLAIFSAAMCNPDTKHRIQKIFSHDGPGFLKEVFEREQFRSIESRVQKTVPQSSMIGMLLENHQNYRIVKSNAIGLFQHEPYSWLIQDNAFVPVEKITPMTYTLNQKISTWVEGLTLEQRELLVETIYNQVNKNKLVSLTDFQNNITENLFASLRGVAKMDPELRASILALMKELAKQILKNERGQRNLSKNHKLNSSKKTN